MKSNKDYALDHVLHAIFIYDDTINLNVHIQTNYLYVTLWYAVDDVGCAMIEVRLNAMSDMKLHWSSLSSDKLPTHPLGNKVIEKENQEI